MKINLDALSEDQLRALNRDIVRRLDLANYARRKAQLMSFQVGDRVEFETDRGIVSGTVVRLNQKTASIETDDGPGYRVSPSFLRKVNVERTVQESHNNLFQLNLKTT